MQQEQKEMLQALYVEYQETLRLAAAKEGLPRQDADDAVQDTFCSFMEVYLRKAKEWNKKQIKAALLKILRNRCRDYHRANTRHPSISIETFLQEDEYWFTRDFLTADATKGMLEKETLARLREGVLSLSREMQDVVVLYMLEERPIEEVCEILKVSVSACRMRICRIRKYLTEWMENPEKATAKRRGRPKGPRRAKAADTIGPLLNSDIMAD